MNARLVKLSLVALLLTYLSLGTANHAFAEIVFTDFSFGSGSPFGGTTTLGRKTVTLTSTNTEPWGTTSFRDTEAIDPATVTFTFSRAISVFHLDISRVRADEFLTGFNIGEPTSLTGTLVNNGGLITTSGSDDYGFGRLSFLGIDTTVVTFTIHNLPNPPDPLPAISIDRLGFNSSPEPATLTLVGCSLGILAARTLLRRRWLKKQLPGHA